MTGAAAPAAGSSYIGGHDVSLSDPRSGPPILRASRQDARQKREHSGDGISADWHYVALGGGQTRRPLVRNV